MSRTDLAVSALMLVSSIASATTVTGTWNSGVVPGNFPISVVCAPSGISGSLNDWGSNVTCDGNDTQVYFGLYLSTNNPQNLKIIGSTTPGSWNKFLTAKLTDGDKAVLINNIQNHNIQLIYFSEDGPAPYNTSSIQVN